ncbi:hypothetical protein D9757_006922 [Collybiopsis confluens]|uniref:L-tryptophan decarboxylase PsiD-like domain-containing protein n=1 Tax=Collybiopsis confluens TaxID=2823264 RepID=A0A8H5HJ10_9AGAR|nr:hypothetical protein D9757_006922 [Collybiopsis confluens]
MSQTTQTQTPSPITIQGIVRPPAESFRKAGWLPKSKAAYDAFMKQLHQRATSGSGTLLPSVQEFKDFVENDPTIYGEFLRMFDDVDTSNPDTPQDYTELIAMLNVIFREAPAYGDLGPPVYMVMAQVMNSQGGFSAFTKQNLNEQFKKMFETYALFLTSKDSCSTLNTGEGGWLSVEAMNAMMAEFNGRTFEQVFICDPNAEHYGFTSFEDFFNRRFRNPATDRPTGLLNNNIVGAACESITYAYQEDLKEMDELYIKDEKYSLRHLLADNFVDQFVGGKAVQGFLNTTGYHRWHSPVNGTIVRIVNVPGTYFAQGPYKIGLPTEDPDLVPPYLQSLQYFANTAARQLMFIQADDGNIGLMCFIAIGMTEISTCEATVYEGQHVERGDQTGMFHFGGSSCALVFRNGSQVEINAKFQVPDVATKINEPIGAVPV